jgi:hypothetical protein
MPGISSEWILPKWVFLPKRTSRNGTERYFSHQEQKVCENVKFSGDLDSQRQKSEVFFV